MNRKKLELFFRQQWRLASQEIERRRVYAGRPRIIGDGLFDAVIDHDKGGLNDNFRIRAQVFSEERKWGHHFKIHEDKNGISYEKDPYDDEEEPFETTQVTIIYRPCATPVAAYRLLKIGDYTPESPTIKTWKQNGNLNHIDFSRKEIAELSRFSFSKTLAREAEIPKGCSPFRMILLSAAALSITPPHSGIDPFYDWVNLMPNGLINKFKSEGFVPENIGPTIELEGKRMCVHYNLVKTLKHLRIHKPANYRIIKDAVLSRHGELQRFFCKLEGTSMTQKQNHLMTGWTV